MKQTAFPIALSLKKNELKNEENFLSFMKVCISFNV